jgi:hypothetical protein
MGQVFADDVAAGGAKDVADEEDIHCEILHGSNALKRRWSVVCAWVVVAFCAWHRASVFN